MKPPYLMRKLGTMLAATVTVALLAAIFASYLRPGFMLDVANRLWLCF